MRSSDRDISRQGRGGMGKRNYTLRLKKPSWSFWKLVNETRRSEDHCETVTNKMQAFRFVMIMTQGCFLFDASRIALQV